MNHCYYINFTSIPKYGISSNDHQVLVLIIISHFFYPLSAAHILHFYALYCKNFCFIGFREILAGGLITFL